MLRSHRNGRPGLRPSSLRVESLEARSLLSVVLTPTHHLPAHHPAPHHPAAVHHRPAPVTSAAIAHPMLVRASAASGAPLATNAPPSTALTPAQARNIYGFNAISNLGSGQTIAIVDAYDDPNIGADADTFDQAFATTLGGSTSYYSAYGPSSSWLSKVYASGTKPAGNTSWGGEISLDVEWAHAIAPLAKIILVEAASSSFPALLAGDDAAVKAGATVISNSWGGGESSDETSNDSHFTAQGVTFVFSAGDNGNQSYPATSPDVVSVGGTTLSYSASAATWTGESAWTDGGGGVSAYEKLPSYQSGLSYARRASPDVAYDADPNSGFAVYDSYGATRRNPAWGQFGGTSDAAPQWSALIALANQGRASAGKAALDGVSQTLPTIYSMTTGTSSSGTYALYDVTSGSNAVGSAEPGYDVTTGRGTPRFASQAYAALVKA